MSLRLLDRERRLARKKLKGAQLIEQRITVIHRRI